MKKRISICLFLLIILVSISAFAAPGDDMLFFREPNATEYENTQTMAGTTDGLYILKNPLGNYDMLEVVFYDYKTRETAAVLSDLPQSYYSTEEEFTEYGMGGSAADVINKLFTSDNTLYALNFITGEISAITVENGAAARNVIGKFDMESLRVKNADYTYLKEIRGMALEDSKLYLSVYDYENTSNPAALMRYDLQKGTGEQISKLSIMEMVPYKDGKTLALVFDPYNSWDEATQKERPHELHTLDLASGESKLLASIDGNMGGIQYDAENDTIYYVMGNRVIRLTNDSKSETVAYMPTSDSYNTMGSAFANGLYSFCTWSGIAIRNTDPQYLPSTILSIYGGWSGDKEIAFIKDHPDIAFDFPQEYISSVEQLAQAISSDSKMDIIQSFSGAMNFDALIKKGYCADLSGYPELVALVERMYPYLKDFVMRDGKLYAVPLYAYSNGTSYNSEALKGVEMTTADLPTTYRELCDFVTEWNEETGYDFPDYMPIYYGDVRESLFHDIFNSYCLYYEATGQALTFDTPLFKSLMADFENMRTDNLSKEDMSEEEMWSRMPVLESGYQLLEFSSIDPTDPEMNYTVHWPIQLDNDTPVHYRMDVNLAFISPGSKNADIAVEYLIHCLKNLAIYEQPFIFEDMQGNIEYPHYARMLEDWAKEAERLKEEMKTADAADKRMYEEQLAYYDELFENKDRHRYQVTQAALDYFRENLADKCFISRDGNPLWGENSEEIFPIVQRFLAKETSSERMIADLDKKIQMILRESK